METDNPNLTIQFYMCILRSTQRIVNQLPFHWQPSQIPEASQMLAGKGKHAIISFGWKIFGDLRVKT